MANTHSLDLELSSSQYAYAADSASLSVTQSLTIECGVNFESLTSVDQIIHTFVAKYDADNNARSYAFGMRHSGGVLNLYMNISSDGQINANNLKLIPWTPSTATWYHVAWVYDHTVPSYIAYVNGVKQGNTQTPQSTSIHNNNSQLRIGAFQVADPSAYLLDGKIDEVRIWNYARTAGQILEFKDKQINIPQTGLVACYNLNNALTDTSGNTNTLTLVGSPSFSTTIPTLTDFPSGGSLFFAQL